MTEKKQKDVTFLRSHFFLFSSITLPLLVLITCFIPKNVTTFHEEEVRSFGFCWSFLWRGNFGLHCPKLAKPKKVLTQKLPNSSSLFLSFWTRAIFRDQFQKKYYVWHFEIKIYEVCEAKMPLNTYFDAKIVH